MESGAALFEKAFENWIFHELTAHAAYSRTFYELSYWQLSSGAEVDFIVNDMELALEVKASSRIENKHLKNLRTIIEDQPKVKRRIVICQEPRKRITEDGIAIMPYDKFLDLLWTGDLV